MHRVVGLGLDSLSCIAAAILAQAPLAAALALLLPPTQVTRSSAQRPSAAGFGGHRPPEHPSSWPPATSTEPSWSTTVLVTILTPALGGGRPRAIRSAVS